MSLNIRRIMPENKTVFGNRLELEKEIFSAVREVPDFPKEGILFKDINPIFQDSALCLRIIKHLATYYKDKGLDAIVGVESRGFFFGFPLALELGIPFIPIRKKGKLPGEVLEERYDLEYGSAAIEVQRGALKNGDKVLVHDDVLATGGTALAAAHLVRKSGAVVEGFNFIIMLGFLGGDEKLNALNCNIYNLAIS